MTSDDYQIWLTANSEKQKIQLPVNPETVTIANNSSNSTINVVELGEVTVFQGRPAIQISFSSFFPAAMFPGVKVKELTNPQKLIKRIIGWKEKKKPIHLIITKVGVDMYCSIESFSYEENGGDPGTLHYTLSLKEYREIKTRKVNVNAKSKTATVNKSPQRVDNRSNPKTYTVVYGDCLWNLAKKFYGDGTKYTKLYEANKKLIGPNPNVLYVGWQLTIPE